MKKINNKTISRVKRPIRILQFGDGNFLRGFFDWMIEKTNRKGITNYGIVVVQPRSKTKAQKMINQDCMFHVLLEGIERGKRVHEITLVTCIETIINPILEYDSYEKAFLNPELKLIISNTTEAGIVYTKDELEASPPVSFPGKMTALLYKRYLKYQGELSKGLHVLCTELIEDNASLLKEYIIKHAEENHLPKNFIEWLECSCSFYNTLVDRIVPGYPHDECGYIQEKIGFEDELLVKAEYYHLWVIESNNKDIRKLLPFDRIGLQVYFTKDLSIFRKRKVRVLNGAHTALASIGILMGYSTVYEVCSDLLIARFINRLLYREVLPTLEGEEQDSVEFIHQTLDRFANSKIQHHLRDISLNSLSKWEARNLPTVIDLLVKQEQFHCLLFSLGALIVLYVNPELTFFPLEDEDKLKNLRSCFEKNSIEKAINLIICNKQIWNVDMSVLQPYTLELSNYVQGILKKGIKNALVELLVE